MLTLDGGADGPGKGGPNVHHVAPPLEFRILGHLEVLRHRQRLELGGPKQRTVLASLLVEAGSVVSIDRLSDHLWAGRPPLGRDGTVHAYVSHLRRVLEPDRSPGAPGRVLVTEGSGYLLRVDPKQLDAARFERLAEEGRRALLARQIDRAEEMLGASLALWRGQALADFVDEPFAAAKAAQLEERRAEALENQIEVALASGRHGAAAAELEHLVTVHPFRDRLRGQLMLALYRSGRQADALRSYEATRRLLRDELGTEPGPALKALERAILLQKPTLEWRPPGGERASVSTVRPAGASGSRPAGKVNRAGFVGRVAELALLDAALGEASADSCRVVTVAGEGGVGKTRLAEELAVRAARAGADVVWGRCHDADGAPDFWPWAQIVRNLVEFGDHRVVSQAIATRAAELARVAPEIAEAVPLTSIPPEDSRVGIFEALTAFLFRLAAHRPLVLILDDLHRADAESVALLRLFSSRPPRVPVLLVGCYRDSDMAPGDRLAQTLGDLGSEPAVSRLVLEGLGRDDVAELMAQILGRAPTRGLVNTIHDRTGGNPFFVTELTRLVGDGGLSDNAIVASLRQVPVGARDVIRHRLARLPDAARQLLETATVHGGEFDLGLVARVSGLELERAAGLAEKLLARRMIAASPGCQGRYRFSPPLIRDTVYDGLPALRRTRLLQRTAEVLEEIDGPGGDAHSVEIARHFWKAVPGGAGEQAFASALRASDWASSRAAYEEAEEQLLRAAEVVHRLPPGVRRDHCELALQLRRSTLLSIRNGHADPQVGHACRRAGELCRRVGNTDELLGSLIRLGAFHSVRLHFDAAQQVGVRLLEAARDSGDPRFLLAGHLRLGVTAFHQGQLSRAKRHLDQAQASSNALSELGIGDLFIEHPAAKGYGYQALIHWLHGDARHAAALARQGLAFARRLDHPYSLGFGLFVVAWLGAFRGQAAVVRQRADELRVLADERGFRLLGASARVLGGWARAEQGEAEEGVAVTADGLAALGCTGGRMMRPFFLGLLACAYRRAGRLEDGLRTLTDALAEVEATGERFAESELHRLRAEFLGACSPDRRAETQVSLRRALAVARSQEAVALERRALSSVARLAKGPLVTGRPTGRRLTTAGHRQTFVVSVPQA